MKQRFNGDSDIDSLMSDKVLRAQRRLPFLRFLYRQSTRRYFCLLIAPCLLSCIFLFLVFYSNIYHVFIIFARLLSSSSLPIGNLVGKGSNMLSTTLSKRKELSTYDRNIIYRDYNYLDSDTLTYEKRTYSNNVPILFRLPKKVSVFALLLIFHGCSRSANDWFHTIERQRIIGAAIDLGYGCLSFQSTDDVSRCWSSDMDLSRNNDVQMVLKGLEGFYKEYPKLESLPRFTFGGSSGGVFSSIFVTNQQYKIQGQIIFISIILPELLQTHVKSKRYPPTAWIYMSRDIEFASESRINESIKTFIEQKIPHITFAIEPISLTATTFHERIPTITTEASFYLFVRLHQHHWLDADNYLKQNPRRKNTWKTLSLLLQNHTMDNTSILENINKHKNILPDFLNTIYGEHEISFERSFEALRWHKQIYSDQINSTV